MKKALFTLTSLVTGTLLILSSCSGKVPDPIITQAVAYPPQAQQLEIKKLSVDTSVYAENATAYLSENGERQIYVYSAPIEDSENTLSDLENGVYTGSGSYYSALKQ